MNGKEYGVALVTIHRHQLIDLLYSLDGNTSVKVAGLPTIESGARLTAIRDDPFSDSILLRFEGPELPRCRPREEVRRQHLEFSFTPLDQPTIREASE